MISFFTVYFIGLKGFCAASFATKEEAEAYKADLKTQKKGGVLGIRHYNVSENSNAYESAWVD